MFLKVARKVRFYGVVQGVNFRNKMARLAKMMGITGWVRNLDDGSVEAHLEGDQETIQSMIHRSCTEFFPAKVEKFISEEAEAENSADFVVIR